MRDWELERYCVVPKLVTENALMYVLGQGGLLLLFLHMLDDAWKDDSCQTISTFLVHPFVSCLYCGPCLGLVYGYHVVPFHSALDNISLNVLKTFSYQFVKDWESSGSHFWTKMPCSRQQKWGIHFMFVVSYRIRYVQTVQITIVEITMNLLPYVKMQSDITLTT